MGIAALVLGIAQFPLGLFCFLGLICGILAIVLGRLGMGKAKRGEATNGGIAKAGLILGIVGVALLALFWLIAGIAAVRN